MSGWWSDCRTPSLKWPTRLLSPLAMLLLCAAAVAAGRPAPFVFIHGLQGPDAAAVARSLGCNTIYLDLPVDAPDRLDTVRELIGEARSEKLRVIVGLPTKLGFEGAVSARNAQYASSVTDWLATVIGALADEPGIDAWATDHYLERDLSLSDADFRAFITEQYGGVDTVNATWGSRFILPGEITRESARAVDAEQVHGVGRASIDVAEYERDAFRDVMALWADTIRTLDPERTLMTGRIALYRSLSAIPDSYDVVQPHMPPDVLEPDVVTHNVHAVEMARRGGRFDVIPWLRTPLPPSDAYSNQSLYGWVLEAGLRGAVGVGLEDWSRVAEPWVRNNIVDQLAAALAQSPFVGDVPKPCAAVIHQPYEGGREFFGAPAYGYIGGFTAADLAGLAYNYRLGHVFGGLDYLDTEEIKDRDLSSYSVIFAPTCLSLPPEAVAALTDYVEAGGALFADLGLGAREAKTWSPVQSPLATLLGIAGAREPEDRFGGFRAGEPHPAFPSVTRGMEARGTFVPGQAVTRSMGQMSRHSFEGAATLMKGYPFQGPTWFIRPSPGAIPLTTESVRYDDGQQPYFLGLTVRSFGAGLTVFAPFSAWSYWPPGDDLHAAVHGDLLARRARYRLASKLLVDGRVGLSGSEDWLHLYSRADTSSVQVLSAAADHRASLGATCTFSAAQRDARGARNGVVRLEVELQAGQMRHCESVPVRLRPEVGDCAARIVAYGPGLMMLDVGGHGSVWGRERRGSPERFFGGTPTRIRVSIDDELYEVEPGSVHEVTLVHGREESETMNVTADHRGRLDFWLSTAGGRLSVSPRGD